MLRTPLSWGHVSCGIAAPLLPLQCFSSHQTSIWLKTVFMNPSSASISAVIKLQPPILPETGATGTSALIKAGPCYSTRQGPTETLQIRVNSQKPSSACYKARGGADSDLAHWKPALNPSAPTAALRWRGKNRT